jgi:predicted dehydrogenase
LPALPGLSLIAVVGLDSACPSDRRRSGVESLSVEDLLDDDRIQAVLTLSTPESHVDLDTRVLQACKHVFAEKPLALRVGDAVEMLRFSEGAGLRVGSAPDTVLETGVQTARDVLDSERIGNLVGASIFWRSPGHEGCHPNPLFYYQPGAGPLFDMGPYYLTALVTLLGPIVGVSGVAGKSERERSMSVGPRAGERIPVDVETHVVVVLEHASGVATSLTMSFEVCASRNQRMEVYGTEGTIAVPDPNQFSEPVEVWPTSAPQWTTLIPTAGYANAGRGYGLADMAHAIHTNRPHRASADLAFHVLDVIDAILRAGATSTSITVSSTFVRPELVPLEATPNGW